MSTRLTRTAAAVGELLNVRKASAALAALREGGVTPGLHPDGVAERVAHVMAHVNGLAVADAVTKGGMVATAAAMGVAGLAVALRMDPSIVSGALETAKVGAYATGGGLVGLAATGAHELEVERLVTVRDTVSSKVAAKSDRLRLLEAEVVQLRARAPAAERDASVPADGHVADVVPLRGGDSSATLEGEKDHFTPGGP